MWTARASASRALLAPIALPPTALTMPAASRLLRWLTLSGVDGVGRALVQLGGTMALARWLDPEDFGLAALIAVYVGLGSMAVSALFEEALVQRRRIRRVHAQSALGASLAVAAVSWLGVLGMAAWASLSEGPWQRATSLAPGYALILFADAALSVHMALARRQRRFERIALANLGSLSVATAVGLGLAWAGAGAASLLAIPLLSRSLCAIALIAGGPCRVVPTWRLQPLRELLRFGGWHLAGRLADAASEATLQTLVTRYFGLDGNGLLNLAMRVVEPLRGLTGSIGHNLATAYFVPVQGQPQRLAGAVRRAMAASALLLMPAFIGLAVTAPSVLDVIAGPAWSAAAPVAVGLALAAAVASASNFLHSGLAARGRIDVGFWCGMLEWGAVAGLLVVLAPMGLAAVGLARLLAWTLDAAVVMWASHRAFGASGRDLRLALLPALSMCLPMAAASFAMGHAASSWAPGLRLLAQVLTGVAVYAALLWMFARPRLETIRSSLWPRPPVTPHGQ